MYVSSAIANDTFNFHQFSPNTMCLDSVLFAVIEILYLISVLVTINED